MVDAGDAIHITSGDRVEGGQVARLARGDEVLADGFEDRIWAAETARGADRDDGRVGDEAAHVCQSDDPGPLHAPRYQPACVIWIDLKTTLPRRDCQAPDAASLPARHASVLCAPRLPRRLPCSAREERPRCRSKSWATWASMPRTSRPCATSIRRWSGCRSPTRPRTRSS